MKLLLLISTCVALFSSISQAETHYKPMHQYKCYSTIDGYSLLLTVNVHNIDDKILIQRNLADFDRSYVGKTTNERRFVYEESDEGTSQVLIQVALLDGAQKGMMAVETHGDDSTHVNYSCFLVK